MAAGRLTLQSPDNMEWPSQEAQQLNTKGGKSKGKSTVKKMAGKRKESEKPPTKKVARSPLHGVSIKKRRMNQIQNSPRRKLDLESPEHHEQVIEKATGRGRKSKAKAQVRTDPPIKLIPAMTRNGTDFRSGLNTLP